MFRHASRVVALTAAALLLAAVPAGAAGAGAETFTIHEHEVTLTDAVRVNPCTGEVGTLLAVARNFTFHETVLANGTDWGTLTGTGAASFTPLEPGGISYSGHFTVWFGGANNNKNEVESGTGTYALTDPNGSTLHVRLRAHVATNARGEVTVETEVKEFRCG